MRSQCCPVPFSYDGLHHSAPLLLLLGRGMQECFPVGCLRSPGTPKNKMQTSSFASVTHHRGRHMCPPWPIAPQRFAVHVYVIAGTHGRHGDSTVPVQQTSRSALSERKALDEQSAYTRYLISFQHLAPQESQRKCHQGLPVCVTRPFKS